jgi:import receptor subunit TOM20
MKIFLGDLDNGVDHLAKAVAVCSQPQSLMALFQQTLPPELFQEIIMRLPRIAQVYSSDYFHRHFVFFF